MKQKGFTLIEIVLALAVGGMVMAAVMAGIYQVVWGTARTNDQVAALTDVNFATLWIKKDLQMAQETNLTDGDSNPQSTVVLSWIDNTGWATENESFHSSNYSLSGTDLMRTYDGNTRVVGRYISDIGFTQSGRVINVSITATGPGSTKRDEPLLFNVLTHMRTEEVQ